VKEIEVEVEVEVGFGTIDNGIVEITSKDEIRV